MLNVYFICYKQSLYMSLGAHVYFFRLDIKLFFSPQSTTYSLIRPEIPPSLIFCFHFSRNMAHSKCQIWPWTWMIISIQNIWLTSTGISKRWLLPRKKEENQWPDRHKEWTWGVREWKKVNKDLSRLSTQFFLFLIYLKRRFMWEMPCEIKWCNQETISLQVRDGARPVSS